MNALFILWLLLLCVFAMPDGPPTAVIGCLLDVSGSMREALETGGGDGRAVDRLRAVLSAALKLARAEQRHDSNALVFVGVFGLNTAADCPPVVDLGSVVDALLRGRQDGRGGYELLIALANQNNLAHITQYIRDRLTDDEARIVYAYLQRHPEQVDDFVNAIPSPETLKTFRTGIQEGGAAAAALLGLSLDTGRVGMAFGALLNQGANIVEEHAVDNSEGLKLARRICAEWLQDFVEFVPRPVANVVHLLEQVQEHSGPGRGGRGEISGDDTLLDTLRRYMYGLTPKRDALSRSLAVFREHPTAQQRVLVLVSDGVSTDGDPLPTARKLREEKVTIATVYLTDDSDIPRRRLYDREAKGWHDGQRTLFAMAGRVAGATHPIPVLASIGWEVPSSGECALYTMVSSTGALDEFCSLLLSARFGSADALLDVIGRIRLDAYVNDELVRTNQNPSDQGQSMTCYAHAAAAVLHMALLRIEGREGACPSIDEIRTRILRTFPPTPQGRSVRDVLNEATTWYRPLRFRKVDEDGARQAVLRRRPVLTTFHLSSSGWDTFSEHYSNDATRASVLTGDHMRRHRSPPTGGGHAVILIGCDPRSLTFLNSWGHDWGNNGSFSVEDPSVLEVHGAAATRVAFYDIYWLESDLTAAERQAYNDKVDEALCARAAQHPGIFELENRCPLCQTNSPIADFAGSVRRAKCPRCGGSFAPEPGHLVQALYARAGLRGVE